MTPSTFPPASPEATPANPRSPTYSRSSSCEDEDGWSSGGSASPALAMEDSSSFSATAECTTDMSLRNEDAEEDDAAVVASAAPLFQKLRYTYLSVILVIYLADGLQGTHLYKLYDGYGFSVASLYCLGFFTGGVLSPITGPWIDKMGRKRAAVLYCVLEIMINAIEQLPYLPCLIACRVIGGLTTNLLHCVFETWLDCEFRSKQQDALKRATDRHAVEKTYQHAYELLMRDAVMISNAAAIGSGYLSHILAHHSGPVGPFRGAVVCTTIALCVVSFLWTENYGGSAGKSEEEKKGGEEDSNNEEEQEQTLLEFLRQAVHAFAADPRMLRVGIVQGFSVGSLQIFVFLWSPILIKLAQEVPAEQKDTTWGLDENGEPAFGLIFMVYMGACVLGGMVSPWLRQAATVILTPISMANTNNRVPVEVSQGSVRPMAVEFLAASCYLTAAGMLLVPCLACGSFAFSWTLGAFCLYELVVGIVSPCEGVIRSLYFPAHARASVWTLPSFMVNTAVSLAVFSTQFVSLFTVCSVIVCLMMCASLLQVSLITTAEWATLRTHVQNAPQYARSLSFQMCETAKREPQKLIRMLSGREWSNGSLTTSRREKQE